MILIYGFGWFGHICVSIMDALNVKYKIIDDNIKQQHLEVLKIYNDYFIGEYELANHNFTSTLVCVNNKDIFLKIKEKLNKHGIYNIKHFCYESKFYIRHSMFAKAKDFFNDIDEDIKNDNEDLENFVSSMKKGELAWLEDNATNDDSKIRAKFDEVLNKNINIFAKIYETKRHNKSNFSHIIYPGFMIRATYSNEDKEFFFPEKIDFKALKNRDLNTKLVVIFGNSTCMTGGKGYRIKDYLQKYLDSTDEKYIVANAPCGDHGIYEMMLLYNGLFYELAPEIVIPIFCDDINFSQTMDKVMLQDYKIPYTSHVWEEDCKSMCESNMPLLFELKDFTENKDIAMQDLCEAMKLRVLQFRDCVCGNSYFYLKNNKREREREQLKA